MMWEGHKSRVLVAAHRGERHTTPENTLTAFQKAIGLGVDMIETDVRMTKDGELVIMHDADVARTTDGAGLVADMTLAEFKALNAADGYPEFAPEAPPTLRETLALCAGAPGLLMDFELKDYPTPGNEDFAYESCDKAIALIEEFGMGEKCVINSFSGKLLEYVDEKYGHRYRLHGYYPFEIMGGLSKDPGELLYCLCMISQREKGGRVLPRSQNVCPVEWFEAVKARGIIPWVGASIRSSEELLECARRGARLVTTDAPGDALKMLREMGLHE